ncbi:unnamed protein product [Rotaria sp. Silwood1]|nr:unnamed protein product [Rotaria sp. Silwood1]
MTVIRVTLLLFILPFVDVKVYIFNTVDSPSVELYDCILHNELSYCRRPKEPIDLNRNKDTKQCYRNGTLHSFADLSAANISISIVLHQWKSSIEKAEQYSRYIANPRELDGYVCECTNPQSFGKNCEYLLPIGTTFAQTLTEENALKIKNSNNVQLYGDIICHLTLECDSGQLCLDWRDICDGVQQCMSGLDEENCDKLEFNECENNEYRCMNGMSCVINGASTQCDDRICPPNQWSCGDGQCILDRFPFQKSSQEKPECINQRDRYFICETHHSLKVWTLSNGRCYEGEKYEELNVTNRTILEQCQYLLKCVLSGGQEKNCPGDDNSSSVHYLNTGCHLDYIQYPKAGIMAPYVLFFYNRTRNSSSSRPDFMLINGTIKCEGILTDIHNVQLSDFLTLRQLERTLCQRAKNESVVNSHVYDQHCHHTSLTFNNRSYSFSNVCNESKECISTYRMRDGFVNCVDKMDDRNDISISTICSKMQRYRFRCSVDEPTCLSITTLGNGQENCKNGYDESWLGTGTKLVDINCNQLQKDQCEILRQYIENSWTLYNTSDVIGRLRIPFRQYCDTFWNLAFKEDENVHECEHWWACPEEQWQCYTGQCIDASWVLDGEWDCFDASDEDTLFSRSTSPRNMQAIDFSTLWNKRNTLNKPAIFSTICNVFTEFPCFPVNVSISLNNFTSHPLCINRHQIGDGRIDCYGAIDERNTIEHCDQRTMLGYSFKCMSSHQCFPYSDHCLGHRCATSSDDEFWCGLRQNSFSCNHFLDSVCFNGTCVKSGRCNQIPDCSYGEDEYMCEYQRNPALINELYRQKKELIVKNSKQKLRFSPFPTNANVTKTEKTSSTGKTRTIMASSSATSVLAAYWCNRGLGVQTYNKSIACFCPPQYYGDKCQYHTDRITVLFHLDLSQSIYTINSKIETVLKIIGLFLFNNEVIMNHIFHVRPTAELLVYRKKMVHFLYSRSSRFLHHKRERYFNQSNIINDHPYSVRIEMYETTGFEKPLLMAVWQYPIYFDYLPVFRLAKVLRLTKSMMEQNPCSNNLCNSNQECQLLINGKSKYICLCKRNFRGENCSIEDRQCMDDYCAAGSLCKPNYRGLVAGNELPYCICPFNRFGERCDVVHDQCLSKPCQNNGSCFPTSKPDSISCVCTEQYYGSNCELRKPEIKLHINESVSHAAAVVQYFDIDFTSLNLILGHQRVYPILPTYIEYRHEKTTAPEIILVKLYSSQIDLPAQLYLISLHVDVTSIQAMAQVIEKTLCVDFHRQRTTSTSTMNRNVYESTGRQAAVLANKIRSNLEESY